MAEKLGPAFAVSRVGAATKYGGTTYTIKAHFHTRDHAETVRRLLEEQPLPPGPFPEQFAAQAELIDTEKLEQALTWLGLNSPSGEMLSWWVGREVNRLLDAVLVQRTAGILPQLARAVEASDEGHDPFCMAILRGKDCSCGLDERNAGVLASEQPQQEKRDA